MSELLQNASPETGDMIFKISIKKLVPNFLSLSFCSLIASFNESKVIAGVINDLQLELTKLNKDYEIILVNDNSSDETENIALKSGVKGAYIDLSFVIIGTPCIILSSHFENLRFRLEDQKFVHLYLHILHLL